MIEAFRAELLKLRGRSAAWVLATMVAFSVLATALVFATAGNSTSMFSGGRPGAVSVSLPGLAQASGPTRGFVIGAGFAGVVMLVLFAVSFAGEYSHGTLANLLLAQPRRLRVLAGKTGALLVLLTTGFLLAEIAGIATAFVMAQIQGVSTSAWIGVDGLRATVSAFGDTVLAGAGWAMLGMVAAVLLRSVPIALAVALAWVFPFENILHNAWASADKWMPGLLLQGLGAGTGSSVRWTRAGLVLLVYVAILAGTASMSFSRRDVTA